MLLKLEENLNPKKVFDIQIADFRLQLSQESINYAREIARKNYKFKPRDCVIFAHYFRVLNPKNKFEIDEIFKKTNEIIKPKDIKVAGGWSPFEMLKILKSLCGLDCEFFYLPNFEKWDFLEYSNSIIDWVEKPYIDHSLKWINCKFEYNDFAIYASGTEGVVKQIIIRSSTRPEYLNDLKLKFKKLVQKISQAAYNNSITNSLDCEFINKSEFIAQLYDLEINLSIKIAKPYWSEPEMANGLLIINKI